MKVEASDIGLESLGQLRFDSAWANPPSKYMRDYVCHGVDTQTIFVNPGHVLYWRDLWGREEEGVNSLKRFAHMLNISGSAMLSSVSDYGQSLDRAVESNAIRPPTWRRRDTLLNQATKYIDRTKDGNRVSNLGTATARILFHYSPANKEALSTMYTYLLDQ